MKPLATTQQTGKSIPFRLRIRSTADSASPSNTDSDSTTDDNALELTTGEHLAGRSSSEQQGKPTQPRVLMRLSPAGFSSSTDTIASLSAVSSSIRDALMRKTLIQSTPITPSGASAKPAVIFNNLHPLRRQILVERVSVAFEHSGTSSVFDPIDTFRQNLSPEHQAAYDQHLDSVRNNERINIRYWDGAEQNTLTDELIYRGMSASTFARPQILDNVVKVAEQYELFEHPDWSTEPQTRSGLVRQLSNHNGQFDIYVYPSGTDKIPLGHVAGSGDILIDQGRLKGLLIKQSENAIIHEFASVEQGVDRSRSIFDKIFRREGEPVRNPKSLPLDFPDSTLFFTRVQSEEFDGLLVANSLLGNATERAEKVSEKSGEAYPTVVNLFTQQPQALRSVDPELYQLIARHLGFEPLPAIPGVGPWQSLEGKRKSASIHSSPFKDTDLRFVFDPKNRNISLEQTT